MKNQGMEQKAKPRKRLSHDKVKLTVSTDFGKDFQNEFDIISEIKCYRVFNWKPVTGHIHTYRGTPFKNKCSELTSMIRPNPI